jgi:hypothetical protein
MNWGKAIIVVFIVFAGFIGGMVYWMSRERVDLVRDDYYQTEVLYQKQIDRMTNARQKTPMNMTYQKKTHQIAVALPATLVKGEIHFYRPADRQLDFIVPIPAVHTNRQLVSTAKLARGYWRVQFTWSDGQYGYYTEDDIFL